MASSTSIPDPNADGCYSSVLLPRVEQFLIEEVRIATANILVVDAVNAGEFLFHILAIIGPLSKYRKELSTRSQCEGYVRQHPGLVQLLNSVHEKRAYVWYCETFTPTTPDPSDGSSLNHTPVKASAAEFDHVVDAFLAKCRPTMRALVEKAGYVPSFLPSWEPTSITDKEFSDHISGLRIPSVPGGQPSLLLHDLGEERGQLDKDRTARIPDIFAFSHHTLLVNTSGSGKTRLLLEGLCRRWGFYIVAKLDTAGIGSSALCRVMEELDDATDYRRARSMREVDPEAKAAIKHMQEVAERRLAQVLLAYFLLLNLLVEEANALPGKLNGKEHRRLWVLLQACPHIFSGDFESDVFTDLTRLLPETTTTDLKTRIRAKCRDLSALKVKEAVLNPDTRQKQAPPFFCVLDEVQVTVTERLGDFMSGDNSTERPILREIWASWTGVLQYSQMRLVLSGTGIKQQMLKDTLSSDAFKAHTYRTKSDIGAFDDPASQAAYIRRYLPPSWSDPSREEFFARASAWLRGRYRSTATLILLLLEAGYQCPHTTIDEYVEAFTEFKPTDGQNWSEKEPQLPPGFSVRDRVTKLDFDQMSPEQVSTLHEIIYDQILYGETALGSFPNNIKDAFVEYGFARHRAGINSAVIDEPLAILAVSYWLSHHHSFSMSNYLIRDIQKHQTRKNGLEAYLAFYMRVVFEAAPPLHSVFKFREDFAWRSGTDLAWQADTFELVTLVQVDRSNPQVSVVTPTCGTASNVGFLAKSSKEVLEWVSSNGKRFTFCFPPSSFGPDLLFFVRSKASQKLLLVCIQAKKHAEVEKATLVKGVRSVTPSWFWKRKEGKYQEPDNAPFNYKADGQIANDSLVALAKLPRGLKVKGADYPVLRVFASWPAEARLERTLDWKDEGVGRDSNANPIDPDLHPLATLHLINFKETGEKLDAHWFLGDLEKKLVLHLKVPHEGAESSRSGTRRNQGGS